MHLNLPRYSLIFGLLLAISTSSCLSNLGTNFGRHTLTVSSNLPNYAVRINGGSPYTFPEQTGTITFISSYNQQIFCLKNGFQEEQITIVPDRQNIVRYFDIGAGIIYVVSSFSFLGPGATPTEAIVGGAGLLIYGFSHFLNATVPDGTFGVYSKYKKTELPFVLYPDSAANPKKVVIGCNSFLLNTQKGKVIGKLTEFGKYKGIVRLNDSLMIDSVRMVENLNQHLIKLRLANKWTRIKKTTNPDLTFSEEPTLLLSADVKELSQNGLTAFDKTELVYQATISIEWTLTNKEGKVLMKKITRGEGSRKEELYSNFNRAQALTAMDDAVRRALNELLFSAQFLQTIKE